MLGMCGKEIMLGQQSSSGFVNFSETLRATKSGY